jgi:purine-binding chemotaxis protein CheW
VESVREIVRIRPITPIPRTSSHVRGVISLRGEIIQVVDLRLRLGLPAAEITRSSRIVVIHADDERVAGILVDAVNEVLRVTEDAILPSAAGDTGTVDSLCARGDQFVSLIDLERALDVDAEC